MAPVKWLTLAGVLVLGACASAAQRRAAETAEIEAEAAKEMRRICALPSLERAAEIKRIQAESSMTVNCGND
jgi:hypothetical protein